MFHSPASPTPWLVRRVGPVALALWLANTAAGWGQGYVTFDEQSLPPGIVPGTSELVWQGTTLTTVTAPVTNGEYRFAFWQLDGVPQLDELGRGRNPVTWVITNDTIAVARYFSETVDGDGDGVPDWFEWHLTGTTNHPANADRDGDGFTLADEYAREQHPRGPDLMAAGGWSGHAARRLALVLDSANYGLFRQQSVPPGLADSETVARFGEQQSLADLGDFQGGYWFIGWYVNGVRLADGLGRGVGGLTFTFTTNTTAVAQFHADDLDADSDGVPDWFEWRFYGHVEQHATADTDGDGFDLREEVRRDFHPQLVDTLQSGGIARRDSVLTFYTFNDPDYVFFFQVSDPPGFINTAQILPTGTAWKLPDLGAVASPYRFGQWLVNGGRIADDLGRSVGGLTILLTTNTTAAAQFYHENEDTDADGIPDWFERQLAGNTNATATTDADGDGLGLAEEYRREFHPAIPDSLVSGGFSRRESLPVTVGYAHYSFLSDPPGLVTGGGLLPLGSLIVTPDLATSLLGFGSWTLNGQRQTNPHGVALTQISFVLYSNSVATAKFYPETADTDADGLPDWWEDRYFGNPTNAVASADIEGDGFTNEQEQLAGTNPRDPASALRIVATEATPTGFVLRFPSVNGRTYRVEYTDDLTITDPWPILAQDLPGTGDLVEIVDLLTTEPVVRFYRVRLQ